MAQDRVPVGQSWRKSSYSNGHSQCVEVITAPGAVFLRDSKTPDGPVLQFTPAEWAAFTAAVKAGEHDLPGLGLRPRLRAIPDHMRPIELQDRPRRGRHSRPLAT